MWFVSFLLLVAFTNVMANDVEDDIKKCTESADFKSLENLTELPDEDELNVVCPAMLGLFECLERVVEEHTGLTMHELKDFMEGTEPGRYLTLYVNIKNMFVDLCDQDSQLNKDYKESSPCYKTISTEESTARCQTQAEAAYEAYKAFEDTVQEEAGENTAVDNRPCMIEAYKVACTGATFHEECGQKAFDTYMDITRRTTLFKYGICNEAQMETIKTKFVDSLEMSDTQRELYRLAFDLRKRRK